MRFKLFVLAFLAFAMLSCDSFPEGVGRQSQEKPTIFPDYEGVTVPSNIAPMNFSVMGADYVKAAFSIDDALKLEVKGRRGLVDIPLEEWRELLSEAKGKSLSISVQAWGEGEPQGVGYEPFEIAVSADEIDPWIAYRLIEPSYDGWRQMGIYQRNLSSFEEKVLVDNSVNDVGCVNCHTFNNFSPDRMMFHARSKNGGTIFYMDGKVSKVSFPKIGPKKQAVYPIWHPNGRYVAYSWNDTFQSFLAKGEQKLEVYEKASDLMFYDTQNGTVIYDERFFDKHRSESFPAWSPDGKWLYFCSAIPVNLPLDRKNYKYDLLRVAFDEETGKLGEKVDTLYNSRIRGGSVSYPRVSPDGKYIIYAVADCSTFPIWHKAADQEMIRLEDETLVDVSMLNSDDADGYHAWSSNSRWVVVASRRLDGRYTRLFISHISEDGVCSKPFLLPQQNPHHNTWRLKSYNLPEFVSSEVKLPLGEIEKLLSAE